MKKHTVLLLLLTLCLSLTACQLPFELPFLNQGSGCFLYDSLESEDYDVALNLIAKVAINPTELANQLGDVQVLEEKYPALFSMIQASDYDSAYCHVLGLLHKSGKDMEKWDTMFCKEAESVTFTDWYTVALDDSISSVVTLRKNGICTVNGKDYYWRIRGAAGTTDRMLPAFLLYDGVEPKYKVDIVYADYAGMYYMSFQDVPQSIYAVYVNDRTQVFDVDGIWLTPDKQPGNVEKIEINGNQAILDGVAYTVKHCRLDVGGNEEWSGTFLNFELWDEADTHYGNCEIYNVQGLWQATLHAENSHQTVNYYKEGPDYDRGVAIYNYELAMQILPLLQGAEDGLDYNGDERSQQEWFDYVYNAMVAANGYGESAQILQRFTILEDLLVGMGTQRDLLQKEYKYDSQGRVIYARDSALTLQYYGTLNLGDGHGNVYDHQYYYEYAADGRISKITHRDFQTVVSTITPTYDEAGKIKRLQIQYVDQKTDRQTGNQLGDLCPDMALPLLGSDGILKETIRPATTGKATILYFWGSWCGPCQKMLAYMDEIATQYADQLNVIAIHTILGVDDAPEFIAKNHAESKILFAMDTEGPETDFLGTNGALFLELGFQDYFPAMVILDANGVIRYSDTVEFTSAQEVTAVLQKNLWCEYPVGAPLGPTDVRYVYDSDMMMPFATVPTAKEMDVLREISYGDYFLNFSWTPDFENYWFSGVMGWITDNGGELSYTSTWETDENHVLTKKTITRSGDGWETMEVHTYTYDENGRLLSETVVYGEGENSWQDTYYYFYENMYFYAFDAV